MSLFAHIGAWSALISAFLLTDALWRHAPRSGRIGVDIAAVLVGAALGSVIGESFESGA